MSDSVNKLKNMLYKFMYGRYGNDQLNVFLLVVSVILLFTNVFVQSSLLSMVLWIVLILLLFRTYSRNIVKRRNENRKYLEITRPFRKKANLAKAQAKDKEHKYFICPNCQQNVRVPKGKGKITIKCPKCGHRFDRKS